MRKKQGTWRESVERHFSPDTPLLENTFTHVLKVSADIPAPRVVSLWFKTTSEDVFSKVSDELPSGKPRQV